MDGEDEGRNVVVGVSRGPGPLRVWPGRGLLHRKKKHVLTPHGSTVAGISRVIFHTLQPWWKNICTDDLYQMVTGHNKVKGITDKAKGSTDSIVYIKSKRFSENYLPYLYYVANRINLLVRINVVKTTFTEYFTLS